MHRGECSHCEGTPGASARIQSRVHRPWCISGSPRCVAPHYGRPPSGLLPGQARVLHCTPMASCCLFWGVQLRWRTPGSLPVSVRMCASVQLSPACWALALGADRPSVSSPNPSGWVVFPVFFSVLSLMPAEAGHLHGLFWPLVILSGEVALSQACPSRVFLSHSGFGVTCVLVPRPSSVKWVTCSLPSSFAAFS